MTDKTRIMFMDIEATNLDADFGYVLCVSWTWEGDDNIYWLDITQSPTFRADPTNDKWIIQEFAKEAEQADIVVFHYGERFDWPYLQTRALRHNLKPLPPVRFIDTWRIARNKLKLHSNRLSSVAAILGVDEKTPLSGPIWIKAMAGDRKSIEYVVGHCIQDVKVLEQVYHRIKALRPDNPKVSHTGCPTCGSQSVQSRGQVKTVKAKVQRYSCNECGHWFQR